MLPKIRKLFFLILTCLCFFSCSKELANSQLEPVSPFNENYKISIRFNWKNPEFTVPASAHVTSLIGMVHSKEISLWVPGSLATAGLEDVAEEGNVANISLELDAFIALKKALSKFAFAAPPVLGGLDTTLNFNQTFSCISFASMVAPSPDWFTGLYNVDLFQNNSWIKDTTVNLMLYDAGTEEGDIFGYDNPETMPRQNISLLTPAGATVLANGNATIHAIGTIRLTRN